MKIDKKLIKELVENLNEFRLTELEYQEGEIKIKVSKWSPPSVENISTNVKSNTTKAVLIDDEDGARIKSPIIGTAYLATEPGAKKFIEVGDKIKKGQTIMIVEAMKTMNHVPSTSDGEVKKILVNDGQAVEFGQTLVILK
jgi:acetyl-CoA carboxylase biotin carboxyl carrier protein|tara:strand:+ start:90 stop:512 length:423 start_codon:yes stop_codon:yes gene_type:complete